MRTIRHTPRSRHAGEAFLGRLATTSAVITEAMHFASASAGGQRTVADLVAASEMHVFGLSAPPELHEAVALMERYAARPWTSPTLRWSCWPKHRTCATCRHSIDMGSPHIGRGRAVRCVSCWTQVDWNRPQLIRSRPRHFPAPTQRGVRNQSATTRHVALTEWNVSEPSRPWRYTPTIRERHLRGLVATPIAAREVLAAWADVAVFGFHARAYDHVVAHPAGACGPSR